MTHDTFMMYNLKAIAFYTATVNNEIDSRRLHYVFSGT